MLAFKLNPAREFGPSTSNSRKEEAVKLQRQRYNDLLEAVKICTTQLKKTAKAEKEGSWPIGPIQKLVEEVLLRFGIRRQAYFGGTFIGPHVKLLTENASEIFAQINTAMKKVVVDDKHDQIDEKTSEISIFFGVLDLVCGGMRRTVPLSKHDRVEFREAATTTGRLWREMFPGDPITPKLHVLEKHAADQLDLLSCLGIFSEDSIEKEHHIDRVLNEVFGNVGSYEVRSLGMEARIGMKRRPEVALQLEMVKNKKRRTEEGSYKKSDKTKKSECVKLEQKTEARALLKK